MSNEKKLVVDSYIGDEILPIYIGIVINHYKNPYEPARIQWKVGGVLLVAHMGVSENSGTPKSSI